MAKQASSETNADIEQTRRRLPLMWTNRYTRNKCLCQPAV